ncbi:hypothetical protein LXA43DRAFT_1027516 [Ganoderma leucocontextum]|nr:hypothetical protein LXA43DRAFT_1027516 [Ganoderma leucocontextum]
MPQQSQSLSLFSMARSKLNTAVSSGVSRDSCSLHRWVLLKNSILRSHTVDPAPSPADADVQHVYRRHDDDEARDEVEEDAFMFPDPHALGSRSAGGASEKQWLDSLLEDLGDDVDDYADVDSPGASSSSLPVDDDDEPLSPLCSPMSSSDDLVGHPGLFYHPPPIAIPYPVPYPPVHPPLLPSWLQLDSDADDPLPYFDADDDDFCMPDAIEDTSDDESDVLSTPYSQSMSSLSPPDPAPVPLPAGRRRLGGHPQVYIESNGAYFYPFELDPPLPFHHEDPDTTRVFRNPIFQEC